MKSKYKELKTRELATYKGFYSLLGNFRGYSWGNGLDIEIHVGTAIYFVEDNDVTREEFKTELKLRQTSIWLAVNGDGND